MRFRHRPRLLAACAVLLLPLAACGGGGTGAGPDDAGTSGGKPVSGGTARILTLSEPPSLDPARLGNEAAITALVGNALYGTLMVNDRKSDEITFKMARSFTTDDGGKTFELKLREGLKFSDGTPLDAEAVKYNWDRAKAPETGSQYRGEAVLIKGTEAVDATTLRVTMTQPIPHYAWAVATTNLNWIASPAALKKGQKAYDAEPVGAGPYTLKKWTRQDAIELVRNKGYHDKAKPYLDALTVRTAGDAKQRLDTVTSGGADLASETSLQNLLKAKEAGLQTVVAAQNGGFVFAMNQRRAPFDDIRARRAFAAAFDPKAMGEVVYGEGAKPVDTLFVKGDPFYEDIPLATPDQAEAQKLFDELAADGKPVKFTFTAFPTSENRAMGENLQTQLSRYKNVEVKVKIIDFADIGRVRASYDFDMMTSGGYFNDPETRLYSGYYSQSPTNVSGVADKQLDAALTEGRLATDEAARKAAYRTVQERLAATVPGVFVTRSSPGVIAGKNVHGVTVYGSGSPLPEELWISK